MEEMAMSLRQQILAAAFVIVGFAVGWWISGHTPHSYIQACAKSDAKCGNLAQAPE